MIVHIANPIYDAVFKYLMEDNRIAKTILSALLKKEVVSVTTRPHEYSNTTRDTLSMFRIDFAAQVRQDDGSLKMVLIELQKTWLDTETLRFRQYLGAQYSNRENIKKDDKKGHALPMVAVYLLGHCVGNIEEPILYVSHKSYNYDGVEVTKGLPDSFVDSLTHDSIIVQIPLLRGRINNRLEKVLSVFDQSQVEKTENTQVLTVDEDKYMGDSDMMYILHRLTAAAANAMLRQDMNVEDEYFQAIEDRDTAIMDRDKIIAEKDSAIAEKNSLIADQDSKLAEKDTTIKNLVQALSRSGMDSQKIAETTGMPQDVVESLL